MAFEEFEFEIVRRLQLRRTITVKARSEEEAEERANKLIEVSRPFWEVVEDDTQMEKVLS